jgi:hypothetical protein
VELIETKSLPYFGFYKAVGSIGVPVVGAILLLIVALQYSRFPEEISRLGLAAIVLGIGVIGLSYYRLRRGLNQLAGKISDKALCGLCHAGNAMAMFGYLICVMALSVARHP